MEKIIEIIKKVNVFLKEVKELFSNIKDTTKLIFNIVLYIMLILILLGYMSK